MGSLIKTTSFAPEKQKLTDYNRLETLVENRSRFNLPHFELNLFETHQKSEKVHLN